MNGGLSVYAFKIPTSRETLAFDAIILPPPPPEDVYNLLILTEELYQIL